MSRQSRNIAAVVLAAIALAGCGGGTKHTDPYSDFSNHPAIMHRWCNTYNTLLSDSGWTDREIYTQLQDTGSVNDLSYDTYLAQIRWCYNH